MTNVGTKLLPYVLADLKWPDPHEADLKSTFLQKIQMLILQFFNGDKKQAEIIGEELFKISEELKPPASTARPR